MKLLRNNKAFTIIEMIVVIAVLGILMLLAIPKFLGYTQDAKLTQIKNDIKAYEVAVESGLVDNENFIDSWITVPQDQIDIMNSSEKVLNKRGNTVKDLSGTNIFVDRTKVEVKSKLKGDFIWTSTGEVVYYDKNLGSIPDGDNSSGDNGDGDGNGGGTHPEPEKPTYPIEHPNGDKEDEDGTITKPDGTVIDPDGTITKPDGTVTKPDGTVIDPDGTINHPNGDKEDPNGTITKPDGTITKPDGTIIKPDGTINHPDGSITHPNGDKEDPDGTITKPDGTVIPPFATNADFTWISEANGYEVQGKGKGYYKYTGTGKEVVNIPHEIYGHKMTSYYQMFYNTGVDVKKIISTNKNITNMSLMFASSRSTILDVTELDTSSVVNMNYMFNQSFTRTITFGGKFDTSSVTDMRYMFFGSLINTLDLSSFNTKNVIDMDFMFNSSSTKLVYVGTSADLNKFNASAGKPNDLVVKLK